MSHLSLTQRDLPDFSTGEVTAMLDAVMQEQAAEVEDTPSTSETRQLLALAENYGPARNAFHQMSWPEAIPFA